MVKGHVEMLVSDTAVELSKLVLPNQKGLLLRMDHHDDIKGMPHQEWLVKRLFGPQGYACSTLPHLCVFESKLDPITRAETNPHYHAFFWVAKSKYNACRQAIKQVGAGNKCYSLIEIVPELMLKQFNYVCKGPGTGSDDIPNIVSRSVHLTDELVSECHSLYWKNNDAIQAVSNKRKRAITIHEHVLNVCRGRGYTEKSTDGIFEVIKEYYRGKIKHVRVQFLRDLMLQTKWFLSPHGACNAWIKDYVSGFPQ